MEGNSGRLPGLTGGLVLAIAAAGLLAMEPGCASAPGMFSYRAMNDGCNCEEYRVADRAARIGYLFRARYRMEEGIVTSVDIELTNNSSDSLFLDRGAVKVASRNFAYQYNDKFLPLPDMTIPPHRHDVVHLVGREIDGGGDWNKIAGEQLRVTMKGLHLGGEALSPQTAIFIPDNPRLRRN
jgi:hypothetical protein